MTTSLSNTTSELLQKLFEWWSSPGSAADTTAFIDPGLVYDLGYGGLDGEGWLWLVGQGLPWRELRVLDRVVHENKGALVFEGVEGVTNLRHRIFWLVEVRDGRVVRVVETSTRLG